MKSVVYAVGMVVAAIYLLNPTAGILELLPDNLPIIGHLDEAAATGLFIACLRGLRSSRNKPESSDGA